MRRLLQPRVLEISHLEVDNRGLDCSSDGFTNSFWRCCSSAQSVAATRLVLSTLPFEMISNCSPRNTCLL